MLLPLCSQIQQQLCNIAGKEAVQQAILQLLQGGGPGADAGSGGAAAAAAAIPEVQGVAVAYSSGNDGGVQRRTTHPGSEAPRPPSASGGATPPPHQASSSGSELAHAAYCTEERCDQPNCAALKKKLHSLRLHAVSCSEAQCTPCKIWGSLRRRGAVEPPVASSSGLGGGLGGVGVCGGGAAALPRPSSSASSEGRGSNASFGSCGNLTNFAACASAALGLGATSTVAAGGAGGAGGGGGGGGGAGGSGRSSGLSGAIVPACGSVAVPAGSKASASTADRSAGSKETRRALLAHTFTCLQPMCEYPQCSALRHKLHSIVPHTEQCTADHCEVRATRPLHTHTHTSTPCTTPSAHARTTPASAHLMPPGLFTRASQTVPPQTLPLMMLPLKHCPLLPRPAMPHLARLQFPSAQELRRAAGDALRRRP